ncbi:MAG: class II glutamine amidotransferase [Gammaproteobacteria bacterium]|nr:class II glutamine amidotransferase [Gammaproteobacteria bacterium]
MCQLLGMNANVPTDICFSFKGLALRGGRTGPHKDGWGIALYDSRGLRVIREPLASCDSDRARFLQEHPFKSENVIAHVRQANVGGVALANTHPFTRKYAGRHWSFAHNGQLPDLRRSAGPFQPFGATDSEAAFCQLLNRLAGTGFAGGLEEAVPRLEPVLAELAGQGVFNGLLSDGDSLLAFCTSKLSFVTRRAPFGDAELSDCSTRIDFREHTSAEDVVSVIATEPLTGNEAWQVFAPGEWRLFRSGRVVGEGRFLPQTSLAA